MSCRVGLVFGNGRFTSAVTSSTRTDSTLVAVRVVFASPPETASPACRPVPSNTSILHTRSLTMVRGIEGNEMSTPRSSSQKKQPASASQSSKSQKSILGFFQKKSTNSPSPAPPAATPVKKTPASSFSKKAFTKVGPALTPQPSSDPALPSSPIRQGQESGSGKNKENGLQSPVASTGAKANGVLLEVAGIAVSSPSRKVLCSPIRSRIQTLTAS
jgi:hypothetical protein